MTCKTVVHSPCTRRSKNLFKRLFKEITESNIPIVVKTTGHNRSVGKHTYLIAQGMAKRLIYTVLFALAVGPLEHVVKFKIYVLSQAPTIVSFGPRTRDILRKKIEQALVSTVITASVPKTQYNDYSMRSSLARKLHYARYILLKIIETITLMGMKRNLHLVRQGINQLPGFVKQCAVGGEHRNKALITRLNNELG